MKQITLASFLVLALTGLQACSSSTDPTGGGGGGTGGTSFSGDVLPILTSHGCTGCHGSNGGLTVTSVSELLQGGDHGPAVIPGNADSSNLVRKLLDPPPFGSRMPLNGTPLNAATIDIIRAWINEGAKNN